MESPHFPPDNSPYWIDSPVEVLHLFRTMARKSAKVTLWISPAEFVPSMVLDVLPNGDVLLDVDVDTRVNQKLLAAPTVIVSGNVDKVPVKFHLESLKLVLHQGAQAFVARAPRRIHKLQRREFYRVTIPATKPLYCRFEVTRPPLFGKGTPTRQTSNNRVLDLSLGGLCLEMPALEGYTPESQTQVGPCQMILPDSDRPVVFDLLFCHVQTTQDRRGQVIHKVGGQFKALSPVDQKRLHAYMLQLEREQRLMNP
jgi:flagellar brake protein